ncbi:3-alpha-hydroxysteroid dehydrogenase-like protein, partial [Cricetulus griseus]
VECHVYLNQSKMLDYCKSKDIALVAYCTLGSSRDPLWVDQNSPVLLDDPVICAMAKKYKQTSALVALRYLLQRGIVVLARSFNEKRIKEFMQVMTELLVLKHCEISCLRVTIAVMKHHDPKQLVEQSVYLAYVSISQLTIK